MKAGEQTGSNDEAHITTADDLAKTFGASEDSNFLSVGTVASSPSIPALIDIDRLVTRHSAVVGTTGSVKSTTVAGILSEMSETGRYHL